MASRLAAGVVNFDSADDIVISAAVDGAPASSTRAVVRVIRGPGVYGTVNVPFQITVQGSSGRDVAVHITPSSGVVTFLDRQVSNVVNTYNYYIIDWCLFNQSIRTCYILPCANVESESCSDEPRPSSSQNVCNLTSITFI